MTEEERGPIVEEETKTQDEPEATPEDVPETTSQDETEAQAAAEAGATEVETAVALADSEAEQATAGEEEFFVEDEAEKRGPGPAVVVAIVAAVLAFCACIVCIAGAFIAFSGGEEASVSGVVTYRQRIALPEDAVVQVQIQDVSRMDVAATVMGEQIIENPGQVPISYQVEYDPDAIDERNNYSMSARIEDGSGKLLFISTYNIPVITKGNPTEDVEIVVDQTGASPEPPPPAEVFIIIDQPSQGATVDLSQPLTVSGTGGGLPEGNVVVQVLDAQGKVLAEKPATVQGPDAGAGGQGPWSAEMMVEAEPGTAGTVYAFSPSPEDNSIIAEDSVQVSLGQTAPMPVYITIEDPTEGATLDIANPVTIRGEGGGLPENNVVVQVLDWQGNVLVESYATVQSADAGGEGPWWVELRIEAEPGSAGRVYAFAPSPLDGSIIAEDTVHVSLGESAAVPSFLEIDEPAEGAELDTSQPIAVSGVGGGLLEGNVVVRALDANDNVLAEQATILQGSDVSAGGSGTWAVNLIVGAPAGTGGRIVAFSPSTSEGEGPVASAVVQVQYGSEEETQPPAGLEGVNWILTNTLPDTEITALFEGGKVGGSAGCNNYMGSYRSSRAAGQNTIEIGPLSSTRMMCAENIMGQEQLYLSALEAATGYQVDGDALTIAFPGGSLLFEAETAP